jgi:hypothetical protein
VGNGGERTSQVRACDITRRVRGQERHGAHQVFGLSHLALWDQGRPLFLEVWIVVEDFLGSVRSLLALCFPLEVGKWLRERGDVQCSEHITRRNAIHPNPRMRPLNR